jgi:molybdenum cofactor cytidylyltransferase
MTAIVILAAGSSSRLGIPKQNLVYEGKTLLQRAITSAKAAGEMVIVVLGCQSDTISQTINNAAVVLLINQQWQEGMASSIRLAVTYLQREDRQPDSIIFMLCDQPYVDAALLQNLKDTAILSNTGIVASSYRNTTGVPVLLKAGYFASLLQLKGNEGAKSLLKQYADDVATVPFPLGEVDIDTEADYSNLLKRHTV